MFQDLNGKLIAQIEQPNTVNNNIKIETAKEEEKSLKDTLDLILGIKFISNSYLLFLNE